MPAHPEFELLQAYLDGELDDARRVGVEERLKREPVLAQELIRLAREDAIYTEWVGASAFAAQTRGEAPVVVTPQPRHPPRRRWLTIAAVVTAVASVALLAVLMNDSGQPDGTGPALAVLEDVQGAVDVVSAGGQVRVAQSGQSLFSGQEVRTGEDGSSTVIRLEDTRLVLAAETRIQLRSNATVSDAGWPLVYVAEGMVAAEVAQRDAKPMVLHSQHAELRGSAGRFSFVSLPDATVIEADDGAGRFTRKSDGQSLEVRRGQWATAASNEPFRVRDLSARMTTPRRTLQDSGPVLGLLFDPEGLRLTSCAGDAVKRWDLVTGKAAPVVRMQKKKPIKLVSAAADGKLAAVACNDNQLVRMFELATGAERPSHKGLKRVAALALSPDSSLLAISWTAGKEGHEVRLYDTALGVERILHTDNAGAVQSLVFSPKGGLLATAADRSVKVWDARSGNLVRAVTKLPADPRALAFSPDGRLLAVGDRKGNIRVIDALTGSEKAHLAGHLRDVCALSFSPDGQTIVSGAADGTAKLWLVAGGREVTTIKAHGNAISSVAYSQDGRVIATGGTDRKIMVWDVPPAEME